MKKKIMILDDDTETLHLLNRILQKSFDVVTLHDPAQLQDELQQHKPDLIIVDHFIGCKTSQEIISDFKKQESLKNIPVIIHSGHEQIEKIVLAANADGFIKKPSGINEIRTYIENQFDRDRPGA